MGALVEPSKIAAAGDLVVRGWMECGYGLTLPGQGPMMLPLGGRRPRQQETRQERWR
jgi:hypothetical protein